jgi:tetratricopeptide (TPR) repeat protein
VRFNEPPNAKLEDSSLLMLRYNIAVLKGDKDQMDRIVALARGKRGAEHPVANLEALALARSGRLTTGPAVIQPRHRSGPAEAGREAGSKLPGRSSGVGRPLRECGRREKERHRGDGAFERPGCRILPAALPLAFRETPLDRNRLPNDLEKRFPEDTFATFTYVPVLRALSALERGKPTDSVELLQIALRYELAANGLNFNHFYLGGLHSAYVRGEALLAAHRYPEAAAEFQKMLDHRGIVGADPIGALAHLQLGRTFALAGDKVKARRAYGDFLSLWQNADSDVPVLVQAKAEYARLP